MSTLPNAVNPTLAGGVLSLASRQLTGQYSWAARPTDKFIVDELDTTLRVAYCRREGDLVSNNEYPFPYPGNLTLHVGDRVIVQWDPSGPYIVGGGSTEGGNGEIIQHNGEDVGEEPGLNFRDSNTVAWNVEDGPDHGRVNVVAGGSIPSQADHRPGDAMEMLPAPPPELPPIAIASGTGVGPGGLPYYLLVYTTDGDDTEPGPISLPVDGTTEVTVDVPSVPAFNTDATGQALYRTKDGEAPDTFYLHTVWADLDPHTITDTTPDASLGVATTTTHTVLGWRRSRTSTGSNDSDLGLSGNGAKVGDHQRVPYLPKVGITFTPCPPPSGPPVVLDGTGGGGPGAGDRQYMRVYHTPDKGDSSQGPASRWVEGTNPTSVVVPPVDTHPVAESDAWDRVDGQALYRTKEGGGTFFLHTDYAGDTGLQAFIDTTPDSSLGTAWVNKNTYIELKDASTPPPDTTPPNEPPPGSTLPAPGGNTCVPQPVVTADPVPGPTPIIYNPPISPPVGEPPPGNTCTGASVARITAGSSHGGSTDGGFASTTGSDFLHLLGNGAGTFGGSNGGGFWTDDWASTPKFLLVHLNFSTLSTLLNGYVQVAAAPISFPFSYWEGVWYDIATGQWAFRDWNRGLISTIAYQPGKDVWIALNENCAGTQTQWLMGTDPSNLQVVATRGPYTWTPGTHNMLAAFFKASTIGSVNHDNFRVFTGAPGNILYDDGGTITGGTTVPTTPSSVPTLYDTEYQRGWSDQTQGVGEAECPYDALPDGLAQCNWWFQGWLDSYAYYHQDAPIAGGTGTSTQYGPPATPPASVPSGNVVDYDAGYQAYLDGKGITCPTIDTATQCTYYQQGWVDAYNAFHTTVGSSTGAMPGGSVTSATCLGLPAGTGDSVPVSGTEQVSHAINVNGPITTTDTITTPQISGAIIRGGTWT